MRAQKQSTSFLTLELREHSDNKHLLEASVHCLQFFAGELCAAAELVNALRFTPHQLSVSVI